ncbi:MAG: phosphate signaling complex protein PhoU [Allosphingosinicella sp.]
MATIQPRTKPSDPDLDELRASIAQMGGLAEAAIAEAMRALVRRDAAAARVVIANDRKIDALEAEVEARAVRVIAHGALEPLELREAVAALRIAGVVERIGDYAKNIAKRVAALEQAPDLAAMSLLPEMARIAGELVRAALDAFVVRDPEGAARVCARDRAVDDFHNAIFRLLQACMMEDPRNLAAATHLLFVAKNLERIGDHATNIAEMVHFAASGVRLAERERGADPTAG